MELNRKHTLLFVLLFPVWGMMASIIKYKDNNAKMLFWLGCVFLGYIHIYNPVIEKNADGGRYAQSLTEYATYDLNVDNLKLMFYSDGVNNDIYQQLLTFLVSRFTTNAHILFASFAAVMGFFYTGTIWLILDKYDHITKKWFIWLLITVLLLLVPIYQINGVRMWTALHVFLFGSLSFFIRESRASLIWVVLTPFIHFSFLPFVFLLFVFIYLTPKSHNVYFIVFFLSIIFDNLHQYVNIKDYLLQITPSFIHSRIDSYLNEDYLEYERENYLSLSFYVKLVPISLKLFIYMFVGRVWLNFNKIVTSEIQKKILLMFLFFASIIQFFSGLSQMVRFERMTNYIFLVFVLLSFSSLNSSTLKLYRFGQLLSFLLVLPLFFALRLGSEYYGISLFIGNWISIFFIEDDYPIILLKDFF